jgi:sulfate adenylyltransferase subunit 2
MRGPVVTEEKHAGSSVHRLEQLEARSIHILREAYREFKGLCMLWSIGKDSTVLLWLARKAFFGHVPFPLIHIDTGFKIPEMIAYRNAYAREWKLNLIVGQNGRALKAGENFPNGNLSRLDCCRKLKSEALKHTLSGEWPRQRLNHETGDFEVDANPLPFSGVIVGVRADEEGSRSKERYFSPRDQNHDWDVDDQPPEVWSYFKTDFAPGTHVRIHPLLDWTEINLWEYVDRERIPVSSLYLNRGEGVRYRSLGCYPCTTPVESTACSVSEIVAELKNGKLAGVAERAGREQDKDDRGTLETLRREGYM